MIEKHGEPKDGHDVLVTKTGGNIWKKFGDS
jgi:hypothetical protein